jgi:hypothetical protein
MEPGGETTRPDLRLSTDETALTPLLTSCPHQPTGGRRDSIGTPDAPASGRESHMSRIKGTKSSAALIVAVIALVAALGGGAVAGVTNSKLNNKEKNQVKRIAKRKAKRLDRRIELTPGPQGPAGQNGETGPQGPKGDKGDPGEDATSSSHTSKTVDPAEALRSSTDRGRSTSATRPPPADTWSHSRGASPVVWRP